MGSSLVPVPNLVDMVWEDRPARPASKLKVLTTKTTGRTHSEKIQQLRQDLEKKGVAGFVVSGLDEVAWLFNLRGSDVHCNPIFFSYAIVTPEYVKLYLQEKSVSQDVIDHLGPEVILRPYETLFDDLRDLAPILQANKQRFLLGTRTNLALAVALGKGNSIEARSPVTDAKAIKNDAELEGMRQCHLRDSAALISYFAWLEEQLANGVEVDEADGAARLEQFRA